MFAVKKFTCSVFLLLIIFFISCGAIEESVTIVTNSAPKFDKSDYASLEKLYRIDVTQIGMFNKSREPDYERIVDFDPENNMYILDSHENTVFVYDSDGKFIRKFGKTGQGPEEFYRAGELFIDGNNIVVRQFGGSYKIVDLEGKYIRTQVIPVDNYLKMQPVQDEWYVFVGKPDRGFINLKLQLQIEDPTLSKNKVIFSYDYPPGFRGPNYDFAFSKWIHIEKNGEFFFPEDNFNEFSLVKYDNKGKKKLVFSRKYSITNYSNEAKDLFHKRFEKALSDGLLTFPENPPVVRKIFVDDRKNVWIVSGETFEDNRVNGYENRFDIFNESGEWLQSFTTPFLSRECFYNNGRIYNVSTIDPETHERFIDVYAIKYLEGRTPVSGGSPTTSLQSK